MRIQTCPSNRNRIRIRNRIHNCIAKPNRNPGSTHDTCAHVP